LSDCVRLSQFTKIDVSLVNLPPKRIARDLSIDSITQFVKRCCDVMCRGQEIVASYALAISTVLAARDSCFSAISSDISQQKAELATPAELQRNYCCAAIL